MNLEDNTNYKFSPWLVVFGGFIIMALLHNMIQTCFSLFMPAVTEDMRVTRTDFSICTSLVAIATSFLAPAMGKLLSSRSYGKKIFLICIIGMGISYFSYSLATKIQHMYISAMFVGIFSCGAISMPISIIINNWFYKLRGTAMSIALAGSGLGGSIITPILTNLISEKGWRMGFMVFGIAIIVVAIPVALIFMPANPAVRNTLPYGKNSARENTLALSWLKKQPFFYVYLVGMFAVSFVGYGSLSHLSLHLADVYDESLSAAIISFFLLILTPSKIGLGWIYDKVGAKAGTIAVMSFHTISFAILQVTGHESLMWIMAVFYAIGISNGTVAPSVITAMFFGSDDFGEAFGYVYSFCMIGMVLGSPFLALVYDKTGSYNLGWVTCEIMCVLSILCIVYAVDRMYKETEKTGGQE